MRVLLKRPDLWPRLGKATGFDEGTLDVLQTQVDTLRDWLTAEGYTRIDCEVPIQQREPSGAEFNGVIDLLALGHGKCLILDHKSGYGTFAQYASQLEAYLYLFSQKGESKETRIAIHWIDQCSIEYMK